MRLEQKLRRLYEAAQKDRKGMRFTEDVRHAFREGEIRPEELSVRRLFEEFVPNGRELVNGWRGEDGNGGYSVVLLEEAGAVNTGMFQFLTGNMIYEQFMEVWELPEFIADKLVKTMPTSLLEEDIPGVGSIGDAAEVIGELEEYPMASLNEEVVRMPRIQKHGIQIMISQEMVAYDRTGMVLQQASDLSRWMRTNKEKRVLDVVCGIVNNYIRNNVASDTYKTSGDYTNFKTSNALQDYTDVELAELLFDEMTDPNTGETITTIPKAMLVPSGLKHTAKRIVRATQIAGYTGSQPSPSAISAALRTESPSTLEDYEIISSPLVKQRTSSASTWFLGDFQRAFVYREKQKLKVEAAPIGDRAFSRDMVAGWKASEWGVCGVREPRHVCKNTA